MFLLGNSSKTDSLFKEIKEVFRRYGLEHGLGFVPDILNIHFERKPNSLVKLRYKEEFTYLPQEVLSVAVDNAVLFLNEVGIPKEKMTIQEKGIEVEIEGDIQIIQFPILELIIQDTEIFNRIDITLNNIQKSIKNLSELLDFAWTYDPDLENRWKSTLVKLDKIIQDHPEMQTDIETIIEKYTKNKIN